MKRNQDRKASRINMAVICLVGNMKKGKKKVEKNKNKNKKLEAQKNHFF